MYRCVFLSSTMKLIAGILPFAWPNGSLQISAVLVINRGQVNLGR
jgi:hypothetical protein